MFDPKALSEYALSNMESSHEDIQNSLNLFQTFKRLYEQNPALLNEILSLAAVDKQMPVRPGNFSYVLGLVTDKQALLITNLSEERSQIFLQPNLYDQIWTIGRDPNKTSLPIRDRRLSRCHAAIRYDDTCGFILYDLNSTNGTYVNGVRVRESYILQDSDLVRLGSLNFGFFTGSEFRRVGPPAPDIVQQLNAVTVHPTAPMETPLSPKAHDALDSAEDISSVSLEKTLHFMHQSSEFSQD
ncbi:MAG: FHA domain-containing protein [Leptolyngbya sp. SIO1E4]|nr:FHA domain-containing protein [Leptolyngbya sp. SIO1E4]